MTESNDNFTYWKIPTGSIVRETPPAGVGVDAVKDLHDTIARGAGETVYAIIGLDFGTSSTKVVVRFPYEAGEPAYAVHMPGFCLSEDNPHLWQTVVWLDRDDKFHPYPVPGARNLHTLKQDLMTGAESSSEIHISSTGSAAAYLAFVLRYVRGRMLKDRPQIFRERTPVWILNVGMATKGYDDDKLRNAYRRVVAAAYLLSSSNLEVSVTSVISALNHETAAAAASSPEIAAKIGIAVFPETTAQAIGFIKTSVGYEGSVFAMVDVGAMTLDVSTGFIPLGDISESRFPLYFADVQHLGVEAYHWYMRQGRDEIEFKKQCKQTIRHAVVMTKNKNQRASVWNPGNDLPVYLMGGGAESRLHRGVVDSLSEWLSSWRKNQGFRILSPEPPRTIESTESIKDFGRLAVAWGLSYPPTDMPDSIPPAEIDDEPARSLPDISDGYISKDQV